MAILRCKMCGGDLEIVAGASVCTCEFCGTQQTVPTVEDEALQGLFNRANILRMKSEFDKASEIYEKILQKSDKEAEAYWGLILCKYGIEYVEDPVSYKRIPTCHRASYDAVTADEDYKNALANADAIQRSVYEAEAKAIDEIQKGIITLAQKEDPYDVFICYKETDENGKRTQDSVIANDIYHQLTIEGFKVFYAAITLEDKLGKEYEPYIFSALNTAKVMLSLGTKPEYFNAVWVKNEWSRFLKIMKKDRSKLLIPCYRDMDAYELPEEFAHLQAQDMSKIGFINDVVRGIKKVVIKEDEKPSASETVIVQQTAGTTTAMAQIKRGNMALEDHDWAKADGFFEEALNLDPECAEAYLGKLFAREKKPGLASWLTMQKEKYSRFSTERLEACSEETEYIAKKASEDALAGYLDENTIRKEYIFDRSYDSALSCRKNQKGQQFSELQSDRLLTRAQQYAKGATQKQIEESIAEITAVLDKRISDAQAEDEASIARVKTAYKAHIAAADKKAEELNADARDRQEQDYQNAVSAMKAADNVPAYEKAKKALKGMNGYKDSDALADECQQEINRLNEEERQERERQAKKKKTITAIVAAVAVVCIAVFFVVTKVIIPNNQYNAAVALMNEGKYEAAIAAFEAMDGYRDSTEQIAACKTAIKDIAYDEAVALMNEGKYEAAIAIFEAMDGYRDSTEQITACKTAIKDIAYDEAVALMNEGKYEAALAIFKTMYGYRDSTEQIAACNTAINDIAYDEAVALMNDGKIIDAYERLITLGGYKDSAEKANEIFEQYKIEKMKVAEVGDTVLFGAYEQDNNTYNGKEDVEWIVLAKEDGKILVISKYALDCHEYNPRTDTTWEKCSLRTWLNGTFLNNTFSAGERAKIATTNVSASENPKYNTSPVNATNDKVFLLSLREAKTYFSSDSERQCKHTRYAVANHGNYDGNGNSWWWLRSPGAWDHYAAIVGKSGSLDYKGNPVNGNGCVRPAMWIDLGQ